MKEVLVADDELSILTLLIFNLGKEGYQVTTSEDGRNDFGLALSNQYDLIILDVMLPSMDDLGTTKALRRGKIDTPILILTVKGGQVDKIIGLEIGTSDYLAKPSSPKEVLACMKAIFHHLEPTMIEMLQGDIPKAPPVIGEIRAGEQNYEVFVHNQSIELVPKEFELPVYFMKHRDRVVNRGTLLKRIWQYDLAGQGRIVGVHISHLRDKIELDPKRPVYLVTVRGFDCRFQEPK